MQDCGEGGFKAFWAGWLFRVEEVLQVQADVMSRLSGLLLSDRGCVFGLDATNMTVDSDLTRSRSPEVTDLCTL